MLVVPLLEPVAGMHDPDVVDVVDAFRLAVAGEPRAEDLGADARMASWPLSFCLSVARPVIRMSRIGGGSIEVSTSPASWAATIISATALRAASILAWTSGGIGGSGGSTAFGLRSWSCLGPWPARRSWPRRPWGRLSSGSVFGALRGCRRLSVFLGICCANKLVDLRDPKARTRQNETARVTNGAPPSILLYSCHSVCIHARGMVLGCFQVPRGTAQFPTFGTMWFSPSLPVAA